MNLMDKNGTLSDDVKASVARSGALPNLKQVSTDSLTNADDNTNSLQDQAQVVIGNIQQMLDGGKLDDATSQKLSAILVKLRSALGNDAVSRSALAQALADATNAVSSVDGNGKAETLQQKEERLWQKIDAANKDIDDDFEKMRKAGINFNDKLWDKHKELMEYLQTHPHDIQKQKELMAVDDVMLMQAEPQINQHPDAQTPFKDAKDKSKDRRETVNKDLAGVGKRNSINSSAFDDDTQSPEKAQNGNLTMDDVAPQTVGQKPKPTGKQHG